ncbi:MAG: PAS domain S-box protein [Hydrogenophilaceae bacterium]
MDAADLPRLLHELQVHQTELEMQNEELRGVRAELEASRERLLELYEFAPAGYLTLDHEGRITEANLRAADLLGMARTNLLQGNFTCHVAPEERAVWLRLFTNALASKTPHEGETLLLRGDGSTFHARLDCRGHDSGTPAVRLMFTDISERKRAEEALQGQETLLTTIADNIPDAIYVLDRAHRLNYCNAASLRLMQEYRGLPDLQINDLIGLDAEAIFPDPALAMAFHQADEDAMASNRTGSVEDRVQVAGTVRHRLTLRVPLHDAAGQVTGLVGIARDITERKIAEAEQRDALVREVHHRIKNNLQSVAGLLERELGRFLDLDPRLETAITQVHAIAVAHGLQGRNLAETARFCDTAAAICQALATQTRRQVTWQIDEAATTFKPVRIHPDEAVAIALVVNELVLNAIKHSPDTGPGIRVNLHADGQCARMVIRNPMQVADIRFDFEHGNGLQSGLHLVRSLLPKPGSELRYRVDEDGMLLTELSLCAPIVQPVTSECEARP